MTEKLRNMNNFGYLVCLLLCALVMMHCTVAQDQSSSEAAAGMERKYFQINIEFRMNLTFHFTFHILEAKELIKTGMELMKQAVDTFKSDDKT